MAWIGVSWPMKRHDTLKRREGTRFPDDGHAFSPYPDGSEGVMQARKFLHLTAADADLPTSAALNAARALDVLSSTPARPDSRSPCRCRHLRALASRVGEICGLVPLPVFLSVPAWILLAVLSTGAYAGHRNSRSDRGIRTSFRGNPAVPREVPRIPTSARIRAASSRRSRSTRRTTRAEASR